ncbi:alpha/beta fold hydrolase [Paenibacillus nanensis]|uniref:alpha/beta fold hydrolase n=1 Tax=Paenibacillus nanensis TaxID=393251 RepID=UPI001F0BD475|nr:alpha/beta hydrolase [Paenibacillus nanensis]
MTTYNKRQEEIGAVFLHGVGLRGSVWSETAERLGIPCLLADFPRRDEAEDTRADLALEDYISAIQRQIEEWGCERFILVAHSISGILAMELAQRFQGRVAGLVAVGAVISRNGGSFLSSLPAPNRWILGAILRLAGTKPPESALRKGLCSDLPPEQADRVVRDFLPESKRLYTERIRASAPAGIPKMYVKLTEDKEITPSLQNRMIAALEPEYIEELPSGHLPMLSEPEGLSQALSRMLSLVD